MADSLTQLQDCLDQLAIQFYASLRYITTHHPSPLPHSQRPSSPAPNHVLPPTASHDLASSSNNNNNNNNNDAPPPSSENNPPLSPTHTPSSPTAFSAATAELAHDLVVKQQQIEALIGSLPRIETSEKEQMRRMGELEERLREMEGEREGVVRMKEELLERVERVIGGVRRV